MVCATDRNTKQLKEVFAAHESRYGSKLLLLGLDVRERGQWDSTCHTMVEAWGGIDVGFNVAGYLAPRRIQDATAEEIDLHLDVNLKGVIIGTQAVAAVMARQSSRGHIMNVSSMAAGDMSHPVSDLSSHALSAVAPVSGVTLYAATKYGVRGFSLAAAKALQPTCSHNPTCSTTPL